jgi:hypothetical protein
VPQCSHDAFGTQSAHTRAWPGPSCWQVLKETMRTHPVAAVGTARSAHEECLLMLMRVLPITYVYTPLRLT